MSGTSERYTLEYYRPRPEEYPGILDYRAALKANKHPSLRLIERLYSWVHSEGTQLIQEHHYRLPLDRLPVIEGSRCPICSEAVIQGVSCGGVAIHRTCLPGQVGSFKLLTELVMFAEPLDVPVNTRLDK